MKIIEIPPLFGVEDVQSASPLGGGHINSTYLVSSGGAEYVLQSVNRAVFRAPEAVMANIEAIGNAFRELSPEKVTIPEFLSAGGQNFVNAGGETWRMYRYTAPYGDSSARAYLTGLSFGTFIRTVEKIELRTVISGFHSYSSYFCRAMSLEKLPDSYAKSFSELGSELDGVFTNALPMRNIHGDAKSDNIIIGERCTVLDLDTAMKGYAAVDFGDMIRSLCGAEPDMDIVREVTEGFARGTDGLLTADEVDSLYHGILWVTGELAARYAVDGFSGGERYFRDKTREQCIMRADQLTAQLKTFRKNEKELKYTINSVFDGGD